MWHAIYSMEAPSMFDKLATLRWRQRVLGHGATVGIGTWLARRLLGLDYSAAVAACLVGSFAAERLVTGVAARRLWKEHKETNPCPDPSGLEVILSLAWLVLCAQLGKMVTERRGVAGAYASLVPLWLGSCAARRYILEAAVRDCPNEADDSGEDSDYMDTLREAPLTGSRWSWPGYFDSGDGDSPVRSARRIPEVRRAAKELGELVARVQPQLTDIRWMCGDARVRIEKRLQVLDAVELSELSLLDLHSLKGSFEAIGHEISTQRQLAECQVNNAELTLDMARLTSRDKGDPDSEALSELREAIGQLEAELSRQFPPFTPLKEATAKVRAKTRVVRRLRYSADS